jgi:maltooligosyltrehalose trehalohydrolase
VRPKEARVKLGAHVNGTGTRFAAFADATSCAVRWYGEAGLLLGERPLAYAGGGYFEAHVEGLGHGTLYRFVVDGRELTDPYARFLPLGVHGPAMIIEPRYEWQHDCVGRPLSEHVVYELHVGSFTETGTYAGARSRLSSLAELGITTIELMPVAAFDGARGWGYDGVAHFAPFAPYGTPDELRSFVDEAHGLGLSVLLDVVYNHFGPAGNYLGAYSRAYFSPDVASPWGEAPNFQSAVMRQYVLENALYWLEEFRFDGLRLDATHAIHDDSPKHILRELAETVAPLRPKRYLFAEDERNDERLVTEARIDALWADDFHHQVRVTLTSERDGYYAHYEPGVAGIARAIERGWLYEGQANPSTGRPRGTVADALGAENFVYCIQNHDQIGNRAMGDRLSVAVSVESYLAASLLLLCLPMVPLLFMGQEWAASSPFLYFTDHEAELGRHIFEGRRREFASFPSHANGDSVPDPQSPGTFVRSRLDWNERNAGSHSRVLELYRRALRLRRNDPVLRDASRRNLRAEAFGNTLIVHRWVHSNSRVLLANFGGETLSTSDLSIVSSLRDRDLLLSTTSGSDGRTLGPASAMLFCGST